MHRPRPQATTNSQQKKLKRASYEHVCLVSESLDKHPRAWLFERALIHILRALHPAAVGTVTGTVSYLGSCVVLALVAVCQNCLDLIVSNRRYGYCSAASKSAVLLTMTVRIASAYNFEQPNITLHDCILCHDVSIIQAYYQALQISTCLGMCA